MASNKPMKEAFKDMASDIDRKRKELNKTDENFVICESLVYTKETRQLNADLGINYLNNHFCK